MKKLAILTLLFLSFFTAFAQKDTVFYKNSLDLYKAKKHSKALSNINKAIKINDKKSDYIILKGEITYAINEDLPELFGFLAQAIKVEPNSPLPFIERAFYFEKIYKYQDAILDYNDALKLAKEDSVTILILVNKGGILTKIQRPKLAHEVLTKALEIDSNDIGVLNNLAMCLDDLGRRNESTVALKRILEIDSLFHPAWVNLGFQASLKEEYKDALFYLNKADEIKPNEAFTLNNRGYVKFKLENMKGALLDINNSIKLNPTNSYAYRNKALIYIQQNNNELLCENLYLAKKNGYSMFYGDEIDNLLKQHCIK